MGLILQFKEPQKFRNFIKQLGTIPYWNHTGRRLMKYKIIECPLALRNMILIEARSFIYKILINFPMVALLSHLIENYMKFFLMCRIFLPPKESWFQLDFCEIQFSIFAAKSSGFVVPCRIKPLKWISWDENFWPIGDWAKPSAFWDW